MRSLCLLLSWVCAAPGLGQAVSVEKTNPLPVYMHYMPWFETPDTLGPRAWGWHWTMNTRDPNVVGEDGRREIASHFDPLIGPYASSDPDVIEYHLLLMKLAGVDAVLIDWYGVAGENGDIESLLTNSNALIEQLERFGLGFAVVLEDRFAGDLSQTRANVAYLREHYFSHPMHVRVGEGGEPLLLVFGPITFKEPGAWGEVLNEAGEEVVFLPLWYGSAFVGEHADGEYAWPYEEERGDYLERVEAFYRDRAAELGVVGGVAYPGFEGYYVEGGVGDIVPFTIPWNEAQTLDDLLFLAHQYAEQLDFLQLATWNDFGEGTVFEPTVQRGFEPLVQVQEFCGVPLWRGGVGAGTRVVRGEEGVRRGRGGAGDAGRGVGLVGFAGGR